MIFIGSFLGISGEVRLMMSVALFAIAGAILYSLRYYLVWDQKLQEPVWPKGTPGHVFIWFLVAIGLAFVGAFIAPSPL
jgi:hypothetical protein